MSTNSYPHSLVIRSEDCMGTSTNFTYFARDPISNVTSWRLNRITIPLSNYSVPASQNWVVVNGLICQVEEGNYTATTLAAALQASVRTTLGDQDFTVTYSAFNGRITFEHPNNTFTLNLSHPNWTLRRQIGFTTTVDRTGQQEYSGDACVDLNVNRSFTLHSQKLSRYITWNQHSDHRAHMIDAIPVHTSLGQYLTYCPPLEKRYPWSKQDIIQNIDFQLRDVEGKLLILNNNHIELELVFYSE